VAAYWACLLLPAGVLFHHTQLKIKSEQKFLSVRFYKLGLYMFYFF